MRTVGKVENKVPTEPIVYEHASLLIYVGPARGATAPPA